jgi:hypothetical protein
MVADSARFRPADDVVARVLDGEAVILDFASGKYIGLNQVATRMWELLLVGKPVGEIHATLAHEFEVEPDVLRRDLDEFIQVLVERRLLFASSD